MKPEIRRVRVAPIECFSEGWSLLGDQFFLFVGLSIVAAVIEGLVPLALIGPICAGLVLWLRAKRRGESPEFGLLFKGFDFFLPTFLAVLLVFGFTLLLSIPAVAFFIGGIVMIAVGAEQNQGLAIGGGVITAFAYISLIFANILFRPLAFFASALVVQKGLEPWPAFTAALSGVLKNWLGILGFILLGLVLGCLSLLICFVGIFAFLAWNNAAQYVAFERIFGHLPDQGSDIKQPSYQPYAPPITDFTQPPML
jgi:hypothetical protein